MKWQLNYPDFGVEDYWVQLPDDESVVSLLSHLLKRGIANIKISKL